MPTRIGGSVKPNGRLCGERALAMRLLRRIKSAMSIRVSMKVAHLDYSNFQYTSKCANACHIDERVAETMTRSLSRSVVAWRQLEIHFPLYCRFSGERFHQSRFA